MHDRPNAAGTVRVQANALPGKGGRSRSDARKYTPRTRSGETRDSTGSAAGSLLDLGRRRGHRSNPSGMVCNFDFAVNDDVTTRGHHVSWPKSAGSGAKAVIKATRVA